MKTNVRVRGSRLQTHEGGTAVRINVEQQLRRSVLACLLWEESFYESGVEIADRIQTLATDLAQRKPQVLSSLALEARGRFNLRHAPLLLLRTLLRHAGAPLVAEAIGGAIQRADEMGELVALYWADKTNRHMLPAQLRKGLDQAIRRFDSYELRKYSRDSAAVKMRDVFRLVRPKPVDAEQSALWKAAVKGELPLADTWEVALSSGADKKATWERLIREERLGYLALLRNLRNMDQAGVDGDLVEQAIVARKGARRVYPFRYVAAARACPRFEPVLDQALIEAVNEMPVLDGTTFVLVDVSGSMRDKLSAKSDMMRMDAGATLASVVPGKVRTFTFSNRTVEVPSRVGMAGVEKIITSQEHGGSYLGAAVTKLNDMPHDRLIVISDEQSHDPVPPPKAERAYMVNVGSNRSGVGYGNGWVHIDGFSESILRYIHESEREEQNDRRD